uniref:Uncharacterized protein n=1 Tax=Astyanax mexicanus TaxID=7994 RepID=A0A8B9HW70_ASTMX
MPQQKDIVKIAIQMPGAYPQLIQLDQVRQLRSDRERGVYYCACSSELPGSHAEGVYF